LSRPRRSNHPSQTPQAGADANRFHLHPEDLVARLGWDQFKTDATDTKQQNLLTEAQFNETLSTLRQTAGVDVLAAPTITSLDRRQAQVKVVDTRTGPGGETVEVGPRVDLVPSVAADGSGVHLSVVAQINQLRRHDNVVEC